MRRLIMAALMMMSIAGGGNAQSGLAGMLHGGGMGGRAIVQSLAQPVPVMVSGWAGSPAQTGGQVVRFGR